MNFQLNDFISPSISFQVDNKSRTWVEIDKSCVLHNLSQFKNIIGPDVQLAVVGKSNAYGHGLAQLAQICQESSAADWLCVFTLSEALVAREVGFKKNILVLGFADVDIEAAVLSKIDLVIYDLDLALKLNDLAKKYSTRAFVHVKVDTGLSRLGLLQGDALELIKTITKLPFVTIRGIFSHFSESDANDQTFTNKQLSRFNNLLNDLNSLGIIIPYIHSSNTAGVIRFKSCHFNFVRSGGGTYGLYKSEAIDRLAKRKYQTNLKLAISWKSRVMQIKELPVGTYISYARTFVTNRKTKVAIIPVGYWDGYNRQLSNKGMVYINGQPANVLGRVCMNMIIVDVTQVRDLQIGNEVILVGNLPGITPDDIAQLSGTINYEVTTRINPGIARIIV